MKFSEKKAFFLTILIALTFAGCFFGSGKKAETDIAVTEIADKVQNDLQWPALLDLDNENLRNIYGLDYRKLDSYVVKIPLMNIKSDEFAIIKTKNERDIREVKKALEKRAETIMKTFQHYLPDQYVKAEDRLISSNGRYVFFVIHEKRDEAQALFKDFFR